MGTWRITGREVWEADDFDLEVPAHITIRDDLSSTLKFDVVRDDINDRVPTVDGVARVEFSWWGADENERASGRGRPDVARRYRS